MKQLSDLQAGDKVTNFYARDGIRILTVEKVTPSGLIKTNGDLYDKNGRLRGCNSYHSDYITPTTQEHIDNIRLVNKQRKIYRLFNLITLEELNVEQCDELLKVLSVYE